MNGSAKKNKLMTSSVAILAVLLAVLLISAGVSVSKFVLTDEKQLVGVYTDFVMSHDGAGQTVVMQGRADGGYVGYIVVTVSNFVEEKISKRDVRFSMREPTADEISAGSVTDAWGNKHTLAADSGKYKVEIVNESGGKYSDEELAALTKLNAGSKARSSILLKITRSADEGTLSDTDTEHLSVVLETSEPYRDLRVFTINSSATRISVGVSHDTYQGYERRVVNLKTAADFVKSASLLEEAKYTAEVTFTLEGDVIFDSYKFEEMYGDKLSDAAHGKTVYTFTVSPGADMYLHFYLTGDCRVTVSAVIDDADASPEKISGVTGDNVVFAQGEIS